MINVGIIAEHISKDGEVTYSEEAVAFLEYLAQRAEVKVISTLDFDSRDGKIKAIDYKTGKPVHVRPDELDSIYFGLVGKRIKKYGIINAINAQLREFCSLIETIGDAENMGVKFLNPVATMLEHFSKEYILDLSKISDIPFIPTQRVTDPMQLVEASKMDEIMLAKPIVAERAVGTQAITGMSKEELEEYANEYLNQTKRDGSIYSSIYARQGLILQPFQQDFHLTGEKKLVVIDGEVTLACRNYIENPQENAIVNMDGGAVKVPYTPTPEEVELAEHVFNVFTKHYPAFYMRVDLIGEGDSLKVNELEVTNPNMADRTDFHIKTLLDRHHDLLWNVINC